MINLLHLSIWIFMCWKLSKCNKFVPIIPKQCLEHDICEDVPNYPYEHIDGVIRDLEEQGHMWQYQGTYTERNYENTVTLSKLDDNIKDICPSVVKHFNPQAAKDKTGRWHFVVNHKERALQTVEVQECATNVTDNACGNHLDNIIVKPMASGYKILCRQEKLERVLIGLDENGDLVNTAFYGPACCSCAVLNYYANI